jgi:energy-coupling factor transporter ATP-binding protein EcfA2
MSRDALVVGINFYESLNKLKSPSEDAEAIAQLLTEFGGFRVRRLPAVKDKQNQGNDLGRVGRTTSVSLTQLEEALVQLFKPKGNNIPETELLFFSGHGLRKEQGIQEGFLATSDVNPQQGNWGVRLKWLRELLAESPVRRQIIWLDCCHSGELLNFAETLREADPGNQENRNRCFITACRAFEVAREQASGNYSVLTGALLQGLDPTQQPDGWVTNYSLADFINRELEIQTQRPLCHNSGKAIVLTNNQPKKQLGECPYKGLESFNLKDAHFFYGRTALTDELIKRVEKRNFVAVLGASGSGKSSVLSAGLLYKLKRGEDLLGSDRWQFFPPFNPGEHPLQNLKAAIGKEPDKLEQLIATTEAERVVLIVDQFEECFTLCKDEDEERQRFLDCLLGTVERTGNKLCLVLGMRADFLDKCTQYPKLADKIELENLAIVKPLDREELEEAIMEPAKKVGLQVEPRLVESMIKDVVSSPGRLPLLQDALRELWNQAQKSPDKDLLTLDSYKALGGIEKTLEKRANKTYDKELKTDAERLVAKRVFLELTYVGEETEVKVTLKSVHKERLVENVSFGESKEVLNRAIAVLEKARLIVTSDAGVVNIAHQALISNWEKLRQWVEENPEARRKKQKIQAAAEEWQAKGKSKSYLLQGERLVEAEGFVQSYADTVPLSSLAQEFVKASREESDRLQKERDRRRRRTILGLVGFSVFALSLAGLATWQWQRSVIGQVNTLIASSEALLASNRPFDALMEALRAGRQLKQVIWATQDTQNRVVGALHKAAYSTHERSRIGSEQNTVNDVIPSPDGKHLAILGDDKILSLWDWSGKRVSEFKGHQGIWNVTFTPDGKQILTRDGEEDTVRLWDLSGRQLAEFKGHQGKVNYVILSPDGKKLATWGRRNFPNVLLWDMYGNQLAEFKKQGYIDGAVFSPDGKRLVIYGDETINLWQVESFDELMVRGCNWVYDYLQNNFKRTYPKTAPRNQ